MFLPQKSGSPISATHRAVMEANPWFASMAPTLREGLLTAAEVIHIRRGAMVYRQGDQAPVSGPAFFGLAAGAIKASTLRHDGHEAVLVVAGPGNWFGETSLIDGSARMHDTTALTALDLLVVSAEAFAIQLRKEGFALAIAALLATRVRSAYGMMEDNTLRSLRARVARKLLALAHGDLGKFPAPRATVTLPQETLAMMLGVTRQTLSKELNALAQEGAIALGYGRIELLSLDALERRI
ncbi:Crp/Fnr family transcriptional regulator [Variovorax sp. LT1P1]|uniref:Crp/Fnr family transcriptional regulator n=1 Tax=Variovorax sp. LT1P1 TaxID=3443730 RepID=UPI003F483C76